MIGKGRVSRGGNRVFHEATRRVHRGKAEEFERGSDGVLKEESKRLDVAKHGIKRVVGRTERDNILKKERMTGKGASSNYLKVGMKRGAGGRRKALFRQIRSENLERRQKSIRGNGGRVAASERKFKIRNTSERHLGKRRRKFSRRPA